MASSSCCTPKKFVLHMLDAGVLLFVLILQGSILNYYIIAHFEGSVNSYFWFLADFVCLFVFAGTLTISYQYLANRKLGVKSVLGYKYPTSKFGVLPFSYLSWLFYSAVQLSKIFLIFKSTIPYKLRPTDIAGPQLLQVTIALSGIIFLLLVEGHNWAPQNSPRHEYVISVCGKTGIEILDTVNFLAILFMHDYEKNLTLQETIHNLDNTILILCLFNFLLPALALYKLSLSDVSYENLFLPIRILYNLLHVCLIDIPFLAIRLFLWISHGYNSSIFLMKNIFGILYFLRGTYPDLVEVLHTCRSYRNTDSEVAQRLDNNGYLSTSHAGNIEMQPIRGGTHDTEENRRSVPL